MPTAMTQRAAVPSAERLLALVRQKGMLRVRDLAAHDIHPEYLRRLCRKGLLTRTARGLYVPAEASPTENRTLAEACKRVPHGVVCLLSALRFHGLTTQMPFEVWLAIDRRCAAPPGGRTSAAGRPLLGSGPDQWHRGTSRGGGAGEGLQSGQDGGRLFQVPTQDRPRRGPGALRDCRRHRCASADELWRAARVCRVANVMRPYMESLS